MCKTICNKNVQQQFVTQNVRQQIATQNVQQQICTMWNRRSGTNVQQQFSHVESRYRDIVLHCSATCCSMLQQHVAACCNNMLQQ